MVKEALGKCAPELSTAVQRNLVSFGPDTANNNSTTSSLSATDRTQLQEVVQLLEDGVDYSQFLIGFKEEAQKAVRGADISEIIRVGQRMSEGEKYARFIKTRFLGKKTTMVSAQQRTLPLFSRPAFESKMAPMSAPFIQ
jgi:hypothetical protein